MADVKTVDGTTVQVPVRGTLVITGDDKTFADWTAEIADPEVLSFTPGRTDGSASFNPGFAAEKVGDTAVTMTNATSGDTVTFSVEVTSR